MVSDAFFFHNQYPYLWAQFQREVVEELGLQDEALIFHRSAAMGSNRYMNLFWAGDQNVDWGLEDGIKSVVPILGHMGLSGYAHSHSDIGGYTDTLTYDGFNITRSAELLGRWGELAAVSSSVFRSHEGKAHTQMAKKIRLLIAYRKHTAGQCPILQQLFNVRLLCLQCTDVCLSGTLSTYDIGERISCEGMASSPTASYVSYQRPASTANQLRELLSWSQPLRCSSIGCRGIRDQRVLSRPQERMQLYPCMDGSAI